MLIKSITHKRKNASVENLIRYIFSDKNLSNEKGESLCITILLRGEQNSWASQFNRIEERRTSFYGGKEVKMYHEILSFSPDSKPTKNELESLINKYLELRLDSPTLALGAVHFSPSHYHAHLIIQGIDCYGKSIRQSKKRFREDVQIKLNEFQKEFHPRLNDSIVDYSSPSKNKMLLESHNSMKRKERTGEPSHKEKLYGNIHDVFVQSDSVEAFMGELGAQGIEIYARGGNAITGVIFHNRKYRLIKTLGIDFEKLLAPNLQQERINRLKELSEKKKTHSKNKQR